MDKPPLENQPLNIQSPIPSVKKGKKIFIIVGVAGIIVLAVLFVVFLSPKKSTTSQQKQATPQVKMKTEYKNPFDKKTQYKNPFLETGGYKNPFDFGR